MQTLDLHHHDAGGTPFKLDQVPSEVIANLFRFLPTLDIGRMIVVCKGFNQILSTNPSLWRIVDLDKVTPNDSAFTIIKAFATRSRNTLVAIKTPERMYGEDNKQLISLLEANKANKGTLRRLDLDNHDSPAWCDNKNAPPIIRAFRSFAKIERLNLTSKELPEAEEQVSGVLTMLAISKFWSNQSWSREDLRKISSVRRLHIEEGEGNSVEETLFQVLKACSPNLIHLSLGSLATEEPLDFDLPVLSSSELGVYDYWDDMFTRFLPSLKNISASPSSLEVLEQIIPKEMQALEFMIESDDYFEGVDHGRYSLETMTGMIKKSDSTLVTLKLKRGNTDDSGPINVDPLLQTLKIDYLLSLPGCPLLSSLYISKEQQYDSALLAEVTVTRNFVSKNSELSWKDDGEDGRCCSLTLYLDASHIDDFRAAEQEVLSRCPKFVRDRVGRTEVREWDGK